MRPTLAWLTVIGAVLAALSWLVIWNQAYAEAARSRRVPVLLPMCCDELPELMADISLMAHSFRLGQ